MTDSHSSIASLTLNSWPATLDAWLSREFQLTLVIERDGTISAASSPFAVTPAEGLHAPLCRYFTALWQGNDALQVSAALLRCGDSGASLSIAAANRESRAQPLCILSPLLSARRAAGLVQPARGRRRAASKACARRDDRC